MQSLSLSNKVSGPPARTDSTPRFHRMDKAAEEKVGAQKKVAAERQFRAAFLRQLLEHALNLGMLFLTVCVGKT